MKLFLSLCRAKSTSTSRPSGMTYIPSFYVVRPSISDHVNMFIRPSGMMPSTLLHILNISRKAIIIGLNVHYILIFRYSYAKNKSRTTIKITTLQRFGPVVTHLTCIKAVQWFSPSPLRFNTHAVFKTGLSVEHNTPE